MMSSTKVMRYMGENTKKGHFYRGRVYKVEVQYHQYSFWTRLMAAIVNDELDFVTVTYIKYRKHYRVTYKTPDDYHNDWRTEHNNFMSNARR